MIRILIATGIYPPDSGGPATYSKLLNDKLPEKGFQVEVLSFSRFKYLPKIFRHLAYFLAVLGKGLMVDIIYAQDPVSVGLPTMIASKILRKKFVLKIVGDYAWEQGSQRFEVKDLLDDFSISDNYSKPVRFLKKIQTKVANEAVKIIVPSDYLKKIVTNWGVDGDKIKVIYNAFDEPKVSESKYSLKDTLSLSGKNIVSVGRLVPWKGFLTLVGLMPELVKRFPDLKLIIVDDGPDREKIEKQIKKLNLEKSILMLGRLSHQKTLEYIKASDLFVLNTSYEGFSHLILESMAVETPVITTSVGGNPEAIEDGESGLLVSYDNKEEIQGAIERLLVDEKMARKLAQNAKIKIKEFNEERMLGELSEALNS